jgi:CheY-like chemotaxis protein
MLDVNEILQAGILIVDDNRNNILLLETLLRNAGYQNLSSLTDPRAVCALHAERRFDLILLDLQMPEMDGFAVMEGLKLLEPEGYLPVLVITAQPEHKVQALQAGAKDFVSKPFNLVEVQTRIHNMLEVRLLYQKLSQANQVLEKTVQERTAQLRESEARFKSFTELSTDWYWEQDAQGRFIQISGPVLEMLGLDSAQPGAQEGTPAEVEAGNEAWNAARVELQEAAAVQARERWNMGEREQLRANIAARRPFLDLVYRQRQRDGSTRYLQVSGEPMFDRGSRFIGYRGIGTALDDRRRPDQEQLLFRSAMGLTDEGVLMVDRTSLHLIDANETLCRMTGHSRTELSALDLAELNLGTMAELATLFDRVLAGEVVAQRLALQGRQGAALLVRIDWHALPPGAPEQMIVVGIVHPVHPVHPVGPVGAADDGSSGPGNHTGGG